MYRIPAYQYFIRIYMLCITAQRSYIYSDIRVGSSCIHIAIGGDSPLHSWVRYTAYMFGPLDM